MTMKEEDRIRGIQKQMIETNETIGKQFISDKNVSECIREIQILMDKWELRPLEKEIVIMLVGKYEKDRQVSKKQSEFMDKNIGGLLGRFKK